MGRILAFLLGGLALSLYAPDIFLTAEQITKYKQWWVSTLPAGWYTTIFEKGPGIFAGLALLLLAVRGRDTDSN
jgi:hypothetical protein